MWKRSGILCGFIVFAMTSSSCLFDPDPAPPKPEDPPIIWPDLTEREDVIETLELSWNSKRSDKYESILDEAFTFFLSPGDVGGNIPDQWDRQSETDQTERMFGQVQGYPECKSIELDVRMEDGIQWIDLVQPTETWHSTTIYYDFTIKIDDDTYLAVPGAKAQYTVRNAGTGATPKWQLVEWRDLGAAGN